MHIYVSSGVNPKKVYSDCLTYCAETGAAEQIWIKGMQRNVKEEFLLFENNAERSSKSKLATTSPFIDATGFVRSKTRLEHVALESDTKCPLIFDSRNAALKLMIMQQRSIARGSTKCCLDRIREKYVFKIRMIKSVIQSCIMVCRKTY